LPKNRLRRLLGASISGISLSFCSTLGTAAQANTDGVPAMYATKAEAEAAAKQHFKCTGAHRMGEQWMPCTTHGQPNDNAQPNH
jgi:hypothetical protein